jgi:hypothetical protein
MLGEEVARLQAKHNGESPMLRIMLDRKIYELMIW